eukprot:3941687-Rhodomonas_salina.10
MGIAKRTRTRTRVHPEPCSRRTRRTTAGTTGTGFTRLVDAKHVSAPDIACWAQRKNLRQSQVVAVRVQGEAAAVGAGRRIDEHFEPALVARCHVDQTVHRVLVRAFKSLHRGHVQERAPIDAKVVHNVTLRTEITGRRRKKNRRKRTRTISGKIAPREEVESVGK